MDFDLGEQAADLRTRLRELIDEHTPEGFLGAFTDDPADLDVTQAFCRMLADAGLLTIAWPTEYGGGGGSLWDQTVVREEMWAHHEPRGAQYMGLNWVGPALMAYGTEEQKAQHLPPIAAGEVIWCQGFSEPEAGSDLASLRTKAEPDGDGWRITGQKIWTSYAGMAQWCIIAARVGLGRAPRGHHDVPRPDGLAGHHRPTHPLDARPAPPQRGVLRRRARRPRRRARRDRRRLVGDPHRAGPRAGRHRPLRPLRAPAVRPRRGARARTGTTCPSRCTPSGPGRSCRCASPASSPTARCTPRPPARCPTSSPPPPASP